MSGTNAHVIIEEPPASEDVAAGMPERFDIISTFDVVHDAVDPAGLLRAIRGGLERDGIYLMLEMNAADD